MKNEQTAEAVLYAWACGAMTTAQAKATCLKLGYIIDFRQADSNLKFKFIFENGLEMVTPTDVMWAYEIAPHVLIGTPLRVKYRMYSKGLQLEEIVK